MPRPIPTAANPVPASPPRAPRAKTARHAWPGRRASRAVLSDAPCAAAMEGTDAKVGPIILAYRRFVLLTFSNVTQTLVDFGLTPPKVRTPLTIEQKAAANEKAKATRVARG